MLAACHTSSKPRALVAQLTPRLSLLTFTSLVCPTDFFSPSSSFSFIQRETSISRYFSTTTFQIPLRRQYINLISTTSHKMDSMPHMHRTVHLPNLDILKVSDPETKSQHLEYIGPTHEIKSDKHLPKGFSETDDEKKNKWFIGSIDCGTTSSRFLIFNGEGNPVASHQIEFENIYPESGYVICVTSPRALLLTPPQMARA